MFRIWPGPWHSKNRQWIVNSLEAYFSWNVFYLWDIKYYIWEMQRPEIMMHVFILHDCVIQPWDILTYIVGGCFCLEASQHLSHYEWLIVLYLEHRQRICWTWCSHTPALNLELVYGWMIKSLKEMSEQMCECPVWARGNPPLPVHFPTSLIFYCIVYFSLFPFLLYLFSYFSIPSLSTIIGPLHFQAGGDRRRPNLDVVFVCWFCVIYVF